MTHDKRQVRRALLKGLAASPFVALGAGLPMLARPEEAPSVMYGEILEALSANEQPITAPNEAINVFDFDAVARQRLSPAHYGYLATGTDNDATIRANRAGFDRFQLRARRLTGVRDIDLTCELFGTRYASPIVLAPVGNTRAFHDEGIAVAARAAQSKRVAQILSIGADTSLDAVNRARGEPVWFQLYPVGGWPYIEAIVRRAESPAARSWCLQWTFTPAATGKRGNAWCASTTMIAWPATGREDLGEKSIRSRPGSRFDAMSRPFRRWTGTLSTACGSRRI